MLWEEQALLTTEQSLWYLKLFDKATTYKGHTREFAAAMKTDRARQALADGAKIIALHTAKIFGDPERLQAMKRDFAK